MHSMLNIYILAIVEIIILSYSVDKNYITLESNECLSFRNTFCSITVHVTNACMEGNYKKINVSQFLMQCSTLLIKCWMIFQNFTLIHIFFKAQTEMVLVLFQIRICYISFSTNVSHSPYPNNSEEMSLHASKLPK